MALKRFLLNWLISGTLGGVVSHVVASACTRSRHGRAALAMQAVSHIADDDAPESHHAPSPRDAIVGSALHHGACYFWATFFEAFFGKDAERSTSAAIAGGATVATAAYITDYYIVSDRYKPGFEAYLSPRSLFFVYAGLAAGLAAGARLRGLRHHEIEDDDEREEGGKAERRPYVVKPPEARR